MPLNQDAIRAYAEEMAGTVLDLDPDLESAAIRHLVKEVGSLPAEPLHEVEEGLKAAMDLD